MLLPVFVFSLGMSAPSASADSSAIFAAEDNNLIFSKARETVVQQWKAAGVDAVRLSARWNRIAPSPNAFAKPGGFNGANANDPRYKWKELDAAVVTLNLAGIKPMLLIPSSGPRWASAEPARGATFKIKPAEWVAFGRAVVSRYRQFVDIYLMGNEPNQKFFLSPQLECVRKTCTDFSPHHYRNMVNAAYPAWKAMDPSAKFLLGELAPIGSGVRNKNSSLKPLAFLRALGCVDKNFKPLRVKVTAKEKEKGLTDNPGCKGFKPARGDGFGFHPYQVKQPPAAVQKDPDLVKLGDLPKLVSTLDKLTSRTRLRSTTGRFNIFLTEFGYETNPPDRKFGVSPGLQSAYLQEGWYIVYRAARVKLVSQYVWQDEARSIGFASGVFFRNGVPKPSFKAVPAPIHYDRTARRLWGQARPGAFNTVTLKREQPAGSGVFVAAASPRGTDGLGNWTLGSPSAGNYLFEFTSGGNVIQSPIARVS